MNKTHKKLSDTALRAIPHTPGNALASARPHDAQVDPTAHEAAWISRLLHDIRTMQTQRSNVSRLVVNPDWLTAHAANDNARETPVDALGV